MRKLKKRIPIQLFTLALLLSTSCTTATNNESTLEIEPTMETSKTEHITLINSFEVPTDKLSESISYWEACRDFLKNQPGYVSTKLHQSIKSDARFQLVNVAIWETPQSFMTASKKMSEELEVKPPEGLKANPSLYSIIRE